MTCRCSEGVREFCTGLIFKSNAQLVPRGRSREPTMKQPAYKLVVLQSCKELNLNYILRQKVCTLRPTKSADTAREFLERTKASFSHRISESRTQH